MLPRDAPLDKVGPHRLELERRLSETARAARAKGGIDLYLPVGPVYDAPVAASFLVSELSLGAVDAASVVNSLAGEGGGWQRVTLDGIEGLRTERTTAGEPDRTAAEARHVDYVLSVPGQPGRWLVIAFSTLGGGDPDDNVAGLLTELFDAIMTTFEWEWKDR